MPHHIDFAKLGHAGNFVSKQVRSDQFRNVLGRHIQHRHIESAPPGCTLFEDETFIEQKMTLCSPVTRCHASSSTKLSICSLRAISVTHKRMALLSSG